MLLHLKYQHFASHFIASFARAAAGISIQSGEASLKEASSMLENR